MVSERREVRRRRALVGWTLFLLAIVALLLAVWRWDQQWLATAGVLLFAAAGFGMGSWQP